MKHKNYHCRAGNHDFNKPLDGRWCPICASGDYVRIKRTSRRKIKHIRGLAP